MTETQSKPWVPYLVVAIVALVMLGMGLGRSGFWEGTELHVAGIARDGAGQEAATRPAAQVELARWGFQRFGRTESGGRFPTALYAILAALALALAVGSATDARAGAMVGVAYVTMPLVFMNSRQILGGGVAQSGFTLGFAGLIYALWGRAPPSANDRAQSSTVRLLTWLAIGGVAAGVWSAGWMLGAVPLLLGIGLAVFIRWRDEPMPTRVVGIALAVAGLIAGVLAVRVAVHPIEHYNSLVGVGADTHGPSQLPTFDALIEHIGHGLFPWTGIAVFGVVRLLLPPPSTGSRIGVGGVLLSEQAAWRESGVRIAAFLVLVATYGLQTFYLQQFGWMPFVAVAPLAVATGLILRDAEREAKPWRLVTAGATFITLLMGRDFLLFPKSSYAALGLPEGGPTFPSGAEAPLNGHGLGAFFTAHAAAQSYFLAEAGLFILLALSALFLGGGIVKEWAFDRPFTWIADIQNRAREQMAAETKDAGSITFASRIFGLGFMAHLGLWLMTGALISFLVGALLSFLRGFTTPVHYVGYVALGLPIAIFVATYGVMILWYMLAVFARPSGLLVGPQGTRIALVPFASLLVAVIIAQLFHPALSRHLSPRDVWLSAVHARQNEEQVGRYGGPVNDPAPGFYTHFDVQNLTTERDAVDWLRVRSPRRLLVVNTGPEIFPPLNRSYRRTFPEGHRQNIPVIDASNSNLFLAASDPGDSTTANPLDAIVMTEDSLRGPNDNFHIHGRWENDHVTPEPARLDESIEYVGYNLDTGGRNYVPAGGSIAITYHFHALREVTGNYQIFVHVDGQCPRVNGDHDPADGKYPVRFWLPGDYVHDTQHLTIPGYCRAGRYQVFIGFFQGDNRMHVDGGDHDHENRIVAATLDVR